MRNNGRRSVRRKKRKKKRGDHKIRNKRIGIDILRKNERKKPDKK